MTGPFRDALNGFLGMAQAIVNASYGDNAPKLEGREGPKYIKVVSIHPGHSHGSAFCFVEKETGNVLKAASWSAPAKGPRSNIYSADFGASGITAYGAVYHN